VADVASGTRQRETSRIFGHAALGDQSGFAEWWRVEPDVGRVAHGVPSRLDRLATLGNAVVPQVAELIGRQIIEAEGQVNDAA
jgi:site-specific DNA-cytosine methylase